MQDERRSSSIETVLIEMGEIKGLMSAQMIMVKDLGVKVGIQNGRVGKLEGWRTGYAFVFGALITVLMFFKEPILGAFSDRWTVEDQKIYSERVSEDLKEIKRILAESRRGEP